MLIKREWATPVVMGAFTLSGVTGIAMIFGFKTQTGFTIHQWLGLTFFLGGLAHITVNFPAYKRHLKQRLGLTIVLVYVAFLIAAFLPLAPKRPVDNPLTKMLIALQEAPLNDLARMFKETPQVLMSRLQSAGYQVKSADQTIADIAGPGEQGMQALNVIVSSGEGSQKPTGVRP